MKIEHIMKHKFFKPAVALSLVFIAALTFYSLTSHSVSGQESKGAAWNIRCEESGNTDKPDKGKCEVFQKLVKTDTGQRVAEFAIGFPSETEGNARGIMILPLGILLETPVVFKVDNNEPFRFSPRYCDAGGCVAFLNMNDKILDMLRKGDKAVITVKAANGKNINVEMSLSGFSKVLGELA